MLACPQFIFVYWWSRFDVDETWTKRNSRQTAVKNSEVLISWNLKAEVLILVQLTMAPNTIVPTIQLSEIPISRQTVREISGDALIGNGKYKGTRTMDDDQSWDDRVIFRLELETKTKEKSTCVIVKDVLWWHRSRDRIRWKFTVKTVMKN